MYADRCNGCSSKGDPRYCDICNMLWAVYDDSNDDNNKPKEVDDDDNTTVHV